MVLQYAPLTIYSTRVACEAAQAFSAGGRNDMKPQGVASRHHGDPRLREGPEKTSGVPAPKVQAYQDNIGGLSQQAHLSLSVGVMFEGFRRLGVCERGSKAHRMLAKAKQL